MEVDQNYTYSFETILLQPLRWDYRVAKWVSWIFNPTALIVLGFGLVALTIGTLAAWLWVAFYLTLSVLVPVFYILWKIQRGEITDFHMKERQQRIRPMLLALFLSLFGWIILWVGNAPKLLRIFAGFGSLQLAVLMLVTLHWKISGHSAAASGFAVFIVALYGQLAIPVLFLIPLMAWARVRRHRHVLFQTVAGSLAGIFFMLIVLYLSNLNNLGLAL